MENFQGKSNEDLRYLIEYTDYKQQAWEQLLKQEPSNEDLRYLIEYTDYKQQAGEQLLKQEPSNEELCEIIEHTDLVKEASNVLRDRVGGKMVDEEALVKQVAIAVTSQPAGFEMGYWHCGSTHCWAGWGTTLNPIAREIEKEHGTRVAGCAVMPNYAKNFYLDNDEALAILQEIASK